MPLSVGSIVGHYKITALLGIGGMGEVYKAQDVNLDRPVALKILPEHLVEDADRVRRFMQEAKSASALNHPHIITIYEIGQATPSQITELPQASANEDNSQTPANETAASMSAIHYMAMEFVDGLTLQQKIYKDKTELKRLLDYLAQAAEGLAKAHWAGIIHRDLKPENIMITSDGYAKVLDFGLAKLVEAGDGKATKPTGAELEEAATAMMNKTQPGMVMGTLGYMSPEQVQGKEIDQRSDIFSFGCILYEATTNHKPFAGDSMIDSLHKIIYSQPQAIKELNPSAPVELQRIIRKCMAKDPAERYQSIKDVALDLRDLVREYDWQPPVSGLYAPPPASALQAQTSGSQQQSSPTTSQPQYQMTGEHEISFTNPSLTIASGGLKGLTTGEVPLVKRRRRLIIGLGIGAVVFALLLLYLFVWHRSSRMPVGQAFRTTKVTKLTNNGKAGGAVISPDGKYIAHLVIEEGKQSLLVRQTATAGNVVVVPPPTDNSFILNVTFSRDSNFLYFAKGEKDSPIRKLYKVPALGGTPATKVLDDVDSAISFSPDGKRFAFVRGYPDKGESAVLVVNEDGSNEQRLATHLRGNFFVEPAWSPDGKVIACTTRRTEGGIRVEVVAVQLADGSEKTIGSQNWAIITGIGWLANSSGLILSGLERAAVSSKFQLWQLSYPEGKLRRITDGLNNYTGISLTADSNALVTLQANPTTQLWVVPINDSAKAKQITTGSINYEHLLWTADGKIISVSDESGAADIWLMDGEGKNKKQLTSNSALNAYPAISADASFIVFNSNRGSNPSIFNIWRMNLDGSNQKQLTQGDGEFFPAISPDGKWIVYTTLSEAGKPTIWKIPADGGEAVQITQNVSLWPKISPDGKFIACQYSEEQGTGRKLAIIPFEGGKPVKSFNIQQELFIWAADGKGILYVDNKAGVANIWLQPLDGSAAKQLTQFQTDSIFGFALSKDGKQFICSRGNETTDAILIKNTTAEMNP